MQHLLTKLAAAAIVVGAAVGAGKVHAGPLPALGGLETGATPVEKAGHYRYYGGHYPYYRYWRPYPYWYYRPYDYGYHYKPYYWRYGYWNRPYYRDRW